MQGVVKPCPGQNKRQKGQSMDNRKNLYRMIAGNIRKERERLHITQAELAEKADISVDTVKGIEHGRRSMSLDTYLGIVQALETTPAALMSRDQPEKYTERFNFMVGQRSKGEVEFVLHMVAPQSGKLPPVRGCCILHKNNPACQCSTASQGYRPAILQCSGLSSCNKKITGRLGNILVFLLFYGSLRSFSGGIHCKSRAGCFAASILILFIPAYLCDWADTFYLMAVIIVGLAVIVVILALSPVESINKPLGDEDFSYYRRIFPSLPVISPNRKDARRFPATATPFSIPYLYSPASSSGIIPLLTSVMVIFSATAAVTFILLPPLNPAQLF